MTTIQQTHVRRRSRVSIPIWPDFKQEEASDVDEKHSSCSEAEATAETHLLTAQPHEQAQTVGYSHQEQATLSGATHRRAKPWRALSVLTVVAAASCLATAAFLPLNPLSGRHVSLHEDEQYVLSSCRLPRRRQRTDSRLAHVSLDRLSAIHTPSSAFSTSACRRRKRTCGSRSRQHPIVNLSTGWR